MLHVAASNEKHSRCLLLLLLCSHQLTYQPKSGIIGQTNKQAKTAQKTKQGIYKQAPIKPLEPTLRVLSTWLDQKTFHTHSPQAIHYMF